MSKSKFQTGIIIFLSAIAAVGALFFINRKYHNVVVDVPKSEHKPSVASNELKSKLSDTQNLMPDTLLLPVPFTPQAPTANWDELHNEACEEASAIMAYRYFNDDNSSTLSPELVEAEIQKLTDWQLQTFGYSLSINMGEAARMIREVYGLKATVAENFSADDIKKTLADGKLVLLPANGRLLGNPYYKQPGPIYHMLVIKGYDSKGNFITNDPGTKRGQNYPYTYDTLYNANGDYSHQEEKVDTTKKMIIVVWK